MDERWLYFIERKPTVSVSVDVVVSGEGVIVEVTVVVNFSVVRTGIKCVVKSCTIDVGSKS